MSISQAEKARAFLALHEREGCFVIPNPWDAGTARLLAGLGFEALATTSAGLAFSRGRPDGAVSRDDVLANAREIVGACDLPVSGDLEGGYGDRPETVAETIRLAAEAGLVGGSIEDATGRKDDPIFELSLATERVRAAVEAARALPFPFVLTARAENFLHGRPDLDDTIRRLQAFQAAGADVLYAPGLKSRQDIEAVVKSVDKPVNVVMGLQGATLTLSELAEIGVKRVSLGSALSRAAIGAFLRAVREIKDHGSFSFAREAVPFADINRMFSRHLP
ncbi:MAG TPA: isocitrate lyase/phosphoenolpyruvate mutase family protein [Alphaproteobacteria bacterium]